MNWVYKLVKRQHKITSALTLETIVSVSTISYLTLSIDPSDFIINHLPSLLSSKLSINYTRMWNRNILLYSQFSISWCNLDFSKFSFFSCVSVLLLLFELCSIFILPNQEFYIPFPKPNFLSVTLCIWRLVQVKCN